MVLDKHKLGKILCWFSIHGKQELTGRKLAITIFNTDGSKLSENLDLPETKCIRCGKQFVTIEVRW